MSAYYNEHDPFAVQWLRNLIAAGHIAPGEVDERSIVDVRSSDLRGFAQCHFFAGIGGWSHALRLAGWGDDRPVWTGSCPCQPFSAAGQQKGEADERHLWPEFRRLIAECAPPVVFGEQVASKLGRGWLAGVRADLEALGFAVGAADLCAAGIGAPHIRQRLWWVADANSARRQPGPNVGRSEAPRNGARRPGSERQPSAGGETGGLAYADGRIAGHRDIQSGGQHGQQPQDGGAGRMADTMRPGWTEGRARTGIGSSPWGGGAGGDANGAAQERQRQHGVPVEPEQEAGRPGVASAWAGSTLIGCADGKARRVGPGVFPLAHGVSARVGRLRGYGNAIVPQVAAEFIRAAAE